MTPRRVILIAAIAGLIPVALLSVRMTASDHADTAENFNRIGADMTDVFIFPSPTNDNNVVVVMDVHGLIPAGQSPSFDPQVLYQMKLDTTGDAVEDLVMQFRFTGVGANQRVVVSGPSKPLMTGTTSALGRPYATTGTINKTFSPVTGMQVFAGVRSDPFFFDLNRFYQIFPDRMTPLTGQQVDFPSILIADTPQVDGFRGFPANSGFESSPAMDFFANLNVLSIVVEMPRLALGGGKIGLWETTSLPNVNSFTYRQQDRLARPAINEVLATVTARRHEVNNKDRPTDDRSQLYNDIVTFMTNPKGANRSPEVANALATVLTPDMMLADLSVKGVKASYLGVETAGKFGGRDLRDDVADSDLMAIFGPTIPSLKLAPEDNREKVEFTTDNVGPHKDYQDVFPYLGNPH